MTDKIYWSDFPEETMKNIEEWMDDPLTQERLAALEKTYEVIMQEYDCTREEAVRRHFCDVMKNLPPTTKHIDAAITKIEEESPINEITEEILNRKYSL